MEVLERRLAVLHVDEDEEDERERVAATAKKILTDFEGLSAGSYEYPPADLSTYSADWLRWYDRAAEALAAHGFGFAGDIATVRTGQSPLTSSPSATRSASPPIPP
jgi:hypothetical protein